MGKNSGSAPQAPNPNQIIPLQEAADRRAMEAAIAGSRVNNYGPTGSQIWSRTPIFDQAAYDEAMANYNPGSPAVPAVRRGGEDHRIISPGRAAVPASGPLPTREQFTNDQWGLTTTLSSEQQQLYDQGVQGNLQQGQLRQDAGNRVAQSMGQPFDTSGAPQLTGSLNAPDLDTSYLQNFQGLNAPTMQGTNLQAPNQTLLAPGQLSEGVPEALRGFSDKLGGLDPMQFNQQAADAAYNQGTRYMDPMVQQNKSALEARLAEQGFVPGTPGYNQAMQNFQDTNNRAYADARDRAVTAGTSSGQANFGNSMGAIQAQIAAALQGGQFQNNQQAQNFSQQGAQADQQRQMGLDANNAAQANFQNNNSASQQNFINAKDAAQQAFDNNNFVGMQRNATAQQGFENQQSAGAFGNTARQQAIAELLQQRQLPLQEYQALQGGQGVQMPGAAAQAGAPNMNAPDIMGAFNNQYQGQLGAYNAQIGQDNATTGTIGSIAAMAAMYF